MEMDGAHGPVGVFALFADLAGTIRLEVVGPSFADAVFNLGYDVMSDTSKSRRFRFSRMGRDRGNADATL